MEMFVPTSPSCAPSMKILSVLVSLSLPTSGVLVSLALSRSITKAICPLRGVLRDPPLSQLLLLLLVLLPYLLTFLYHSQLRSMTGSLLVIPAARERKIPVLHCLHPITTETVATRTLTVAVGSLMTHLRIPDHAASVGIVVVRGMFKINVLARRWIAVILLPRVRTRRRMVGLTALRMPLLLKMMACGLSSNPRTFSRMISVFPLCPRLNPSALGTMYSPILQLRVLRMMVTLCPTSSLFRIRNLKVEMLRVTIGSRRLKIFLLMCQPLRKSCLWRSQTSLRTKPMATVLMLYLLRKLLRLAPVLSSMTLDLLSISRRTVINSLLTKKYPHDHLQLQINRVLMQLELVIWSLTCRMAWMCRS